MKIENGIYLLFEETKNGKYQFEKFKFLRSAVSPSLVLPSPMQRYKKEKYDMHHTSSENW